MEAQRQINTFPTVAKPGMPTSVKLFSQNFSQKKWMRERRGYAISESKVFGQLLCSINANKMKYKKVNVGETDWLGQIKRRKEDKKQGRYERD